MKLLFSNDWLREKIASDPDADPEAGDLCGEADMSYSFSITADTKDKAGVKVEAELAKVVNGQPSHESDRQAAQDAAERFIDVLRDLREGEHIGLSMSGSLSWQETGVFTGASVNISAYIAPKG
jgi:hypothetical protein